MDLYKTDLFPYIQGEALVGKPSVTLTMTTVEVEKLPSNRGVEETKYILYFKETKKGLILNKTNAARIIALYGRETDDWAGERIALYSEKVKAFGKNHNAVRVDERKPKANGDTHDDPFPTPDDDPTPEADIIDPDDVFPAAQGGLFPDDEPEPEATNGAYAE